MNSWWRWRCMQRMTLPSSTLRAANRVACHAACSPWCQDGPFSSDGRAPGSATSSTESTMAWAGGRRRARPHRAVWRPIGIVRKRRTRFARQMRCTELTLMPVALAIMAAQWVASAGGSLRRQGDHPLGHLRAERRDLAVSCRAATVVALLGESAMDRQVFDLPVRRMIPLVPVPSALCSTIRARQTCFWATLRSPTSASRRRRSAGLKMMLIPGRMSQTRTQRVRRESPSGFKCQILSTTQ